MSTHFAYLNGKIVPAEEAAVSIFDRGIMYGDGLFETIRMQNRKCVRLNSHLDRLRIGAHTLKFNDILSNIDFTNAITAICEANHLTDARVRLTITRGRSEPGKLWPVKQNEPTIIITADFLPPPSLEPVRVIISSIRRDENNPLSAVKSLNYLPGILARIEAEQGGVDDAILLNTRGNIVEGTIGNIFIIAGNRLITPSLDQGVLPGTVRAAVLALAPELGLDAIECPVTMQDLTNADELFFTNAIQLVRPISEVDGKEIGAGVYAKCAHVLEMLSV